jgi:NADPH-dependent glutamate synthase beta subunit-like oxidoreductase
LATVNSMANREIVDKILDADELKNCYECGICTASCPVAELLGKDYNPRHLLEKTVLEPECVVNSPAPWFCAWCYRCYKRCNQGLKLPEIFLEMRKLALQQGKTGPSEQALSRIAENIPLPLVATLVCFHPERAGLDREKTLDKLGSMYDDYLKRVKAERAQEVSEERVAVIGSGPAGLTVAFELSKKGYGVTVFEALAEPGGMLRKCIPSFRLPKQYVDKEIKALTDLGVEIKKNVSVGQDVNFNGLSREGYRAVFIGIGAQKSSSLRVEGGELKGVIHALEFLWNCNCGTGPTVGKNVVVIGGGNVAVDAARVAKLAGAKDVAILYRRSEDEMPAIPWEVKEAVAEGVKIDFLVSPKKIVGENGAVRAVECVRMELGEPDESGRRKAKPIVGSEFQRETDMVILAIGEAPDVEFLPKEIELNEDGTVCVDPVTMATSVPGVFGAGDVVSGPATVMEAICSGKRAAESIMAYLRSLRR